MTILLIDCAGIVLCLCAMAWLRKLPERYFEDMMKTKGVSK